MNPQPVALVVNDDPAQLHIASTILSHDGIEVTSCSGAERALDVLVEGAAVDIIATDLYMPRIDGWRLCRLLRSDAYREFNRIPILVLSATFSGADAEAITAQLGADAFLSSLYEPRVLRQLVRDLLGNTKPLGQSVAARPRRCHAAPFQSQSICREPLFQNFGVWKLRNATKVLVWDFISLKNSLKRTGDGSKLRAPSAKAACCRFFCLWQRRSSIMMGRASTVG